MRESVFLLFHSKAHQPRETTVLQQHNLRLLLILIQTTFGIRTFWKRCAKQSSKMMITFCGIADRIILATREPQMANGF